MNYQLGQDPNLLPGEIPVDSNLLMLGFLALAAFVFLGGDAERPSKTRGYYVIRDKKTGKEVKRYRASDFD